MNIHSTLIADVTIRGIERDADRLPELLKGDLTSVC